MSIKNVNVTTITDQIDRHQPHTFSYGQRKVLRITCRTLDADLVLKLVIPTDSTRLTMRNFPNENVDPIVQRKFVMSYVPLVPIKYRLES